MGDDEQLKRNDSSPLHITLSRWMGKEEAAPK